MSEAEGECVECDKLIALAGANQFKTINNEIIKPLCMECFKYFYGEE